MSKYLDERGTKRLWDEVKNLPGGGSGATFGETMVEKNGVADVKTPVKRIISQEEFDTLSEKEKNHGLWVVTDSSSGGGPSTQANIFGVMWDSSNPSTALTRLTSENDPNDFVNTNITKEPVAAVGNGVGSSPFDEYFPWKGMEEYNIIDNEVKYKKDRDPEFSRTDYDTVVCVPEFYYKVIKDEHLWYWYVSDSKVYDFEKHPGSGRYVGKYNTGAGYVSKSGIAPLAYTSFNDFRTGARNKDNGWYLYDYATLCAICLLYIVEFSDWDSQKKIGRGWVDNNTTTRNTGGTDAMIYHTGREAGDDGKTQIQYRNIEDPYGNGFDAVDGINFYNGTAYISTNPEDYASDSFINYIDCGITIPSKGFISELGYSSEFKWTFLSKNNLGSDSTYIPDCMECSITEWRVLFAGGNRVFDSRAGLFGSNINNNGSGSGFALISRLLYIPKEVSE